MTCLPSESFFLLTVILLSEQRCYHLGSAIDDNPLAVLASQNMRGLSEGLFVYLTYCYITVTSLSPKVTSLFTPLSLHFYEKSHHFCMKVTSLSRKVISLLQKLNETDIQSLATPFPLPTSSPLPSIYTAPKMSCCSSACDS